MKLLLNKWMFNEVINIVILMIWEKNGILNLLWEKINYYGVVHVGQVLQVKKVMELYL